MSLRRPPLFPLVLALLGVSILCTLGAWQLTRYQWRVSEFAKCEEREGSLSANIIAEAKASPDGCSVSIVGTLQPQPVIAVGYHVQDEVMGTQIFGVLRDQNNNGVFVNLGWAADAPQTLPEKTITASGKWITPNGSNAFTPDQDKAQENNSIWFALDMEQMVPHYGLENIASKVLYPSEIMPTVLHPFTPSTLRQTYLKPFTHLQYAGFWFTLAVALIAIFILRFCRK